MGLRVLTLLLCILQTLIPYPYRRLPALVAPALEPELAALLARLANAFPPVEACLAASGMSAPSAPGALSGSRSGVEEPGDPGALAGSDSEGDGAPRQGAHAPYLQQFWVLRHGDAALLHADQSHTARRGGPSLLRLKLVVR